ncbi:DNA-binding transcriptional regulator, MarR family [Agrococcus jejuensis]|uniref:DNA-binding transcriptional regulator, MarR family n=2 Tax=Agrococcus jejuensis TaxID=399736 RepID=A0A1G8CR10_9MICO|nr:DNA-binding transcriptional regulator, MarR family [Agrococcus jejuensis]
MMAVHRALAVLAASDEPMSITDLGAAIGIDQPRASRVVQMLQHEGLVRREPDPSDARRTRIVVTAKGRGHADEHRERRAAPVAEALAALEPSERQQLAALLARVVAAWPRA